MAAIDWPSSLPVALVGTLQEIVGESFVSDPAQIGAARRRKRFTRILKTFMFRLTLTNAEAAALRTFVDTTSDGGVLEFNWTHPVTAVAYEMRFASLPQVSQLTIGAWSAAVELEEI